MGHKHKDKYISIRDIYKNIRKAFDKYFLFCKERERKVYKSIDMNKFLKFSINSISKENDLSNLYYLVQLNYI